MPAAETLLAYLGTHRRASMLTVLEALQQHASLVESLEAINTLATGGFLVYDIQVTLSLTPLGIALSTHTKSAP